MEERLEFLNNSRSAFNAVDSISKMLLKEGYEEIKENEEFKISKGKKYFITRNDSSIIALNVGAKLDDPSLLITASHTDCPSFYLKPKSTVYENGFLKLNNEFYGSPIYYSWLDKPLSVAGRLIIKEDGEIKTIVYDYKKPFCVIPSLAIHMNREVNHGYALNAQVDMMPLVSLENKDLKDIFTKDVGKEVVSYDLYLYPLIDAFIWDDGNLITSHHLDDLQCAYTCLKGFINNFNDENINVFACFDNEEVGSDTRQGAESDFLKSVLLRTASSLDIDYYRLIANGFMCSCDNAQGLHPNHPEMYDVENRTYLNKGVVIKHSIGAYTSDGLSMGIIKDLFDRNNVPYQFFTNRSDKKGGHTLGNLAITHTSMLAVDLGLAQLAMHSCIETAGNKDIDVMIKAMEVFYKSHYKNGTLK